MRIRMIHIPTGNNGVFLKEYTPTGKELTTQIKMDDGRIYFAPSSEFIKVIDDTNMQEKTPEQFNATKDYLRTASLINQQLYPEPTPEEIKEMVGLIETRMEYKPINRIKNAGVKEGYLKVLEILRDPSSQKEAVSAIKSGEIVIYPFDDMKTAQGRAIASLALDYLAGRLSKETLIGIPVKD